MKIAVLGASGRTGAHVVKQGLQRGHQICAVARNVQMLNGAEPNLTPLALDGDARLVVVSAAPVGPRGEQARLERWVLMPVLDRLFGATYEDMARMESILQDSSADWTVLRPPRLLEKRATGAYRLGTKPLPKGRAITYPDLAQALLDVVESPRHSRQALYAAN